MRLDEPGEADAGLEQRAEGSKLAEYATKAELIYRNLRRAILSGEYPAGSRVVLDHVAKQYGVSKVPVREAVTRLIGEGWLRNSPHVGPVVPLLTSQEVLETAVIRSALEAEAVRTAVPFHGEETLAAARSILQEMDDGMRNEDLDFPGCNQRLHSAFIAPTPHLRLRQMSSELGEVARRYQLIRWVPEVHRTTHEEHHTIFEAICGGDATSAAELTRRHVLDAAEKLVRRLDEDGPDQKRRVGRGPGGAATAGIGDADQASPLGGG